MNSYLIPANTKRGELILNTFTIGDLILLGTGVGITLILLFSISPDNLLKTVIILGPALICGFLVLPIPNYHNVKTVITSGLEFLIGRRVFIWKGWCIYEYQEENKK